MVISIDPYRTISETLGQAAGDRLLQSAAERLRKIINGENLVGYWGGDEFVVVLQDSGIMHAMDMVGKIQEQLKPAFVAETREFYITSSIGIAMYPQHGESVDGMLHNAGAALLRAKANGSNHYRIYTAEMNARALERLALENSLRRALERNEFTIHYQPQVANGSWKIVAAEALIRWRHPVLGLLPPAEFIPLAEETGLIVPLGEWVLRNACAQLKQWHADGFSRLDLAVNISARQFHENNPVDTVVAVLNEVGLAPRYLTLELTETSLIANTDSVRRSLDRLNQLGVKLSIDDFGTGFSSFEYLRRLPVRILKIDEAFVRNACVDQDDAAVIIAIVDLAHRLRLNVIAEGIETEAQLQLLHEVGCDAMQGYVLAKPLPSEQFRSLLSEADYKANIGFLRRAFAPRPKLSRIAGYGAPLTRRPLLMH